MSQKNKPCLAVVSPFVDRSHGTELFVAEWIEYLAAAFEIHLYSQSVRDLDPAKFVWHRVPAIPGPHLFGYAWWFVANQVQRAFDRNFRRARYDLVFSPGINCFRADAVSVHVVFAAYAQNNAANLALLKHSVRQWPLLVHRKLYYRLIQFLEHRIYRRPATVLIPTARKTSRQLARFFNRADSGTVVYAGLNHTRFNPQTRFSLREQARKEMGLKQNSFAVLLIGNDWRNKGVPALLEALKELDAPAVELLLVSREDPRVVRDMVRHHNLEGRVQFLPPRADVEFYYAAADAYVGPSLEDSYALPPAEAMACGLPVIVSSAAGISEIVSHGLDALVLQDPSNVAALSAMIRRLYEDAALCADLGRNAARTASKYTWERAGKEVNAILQEALRRKNPSAAEALAQDF